MQNYKNHIRFNPLHHFVLAPFSLTLVIWSVVNLLNAEDNVLSALYFLLIALTLLILSFISRMYATKNQDRTIRLEMRLRYFQMTGKSFQEKESQLITSQIIALRFASDDEVLELIERAINEKLPAKEIKKNIKDWSPDYMRV